MQPSEALSGLVSRSLSQPGSEMAAEQLQYMPEKSTAGMSSSATTPAPAAPRTDASLTVPRLWASLDRVRQIRFSSARNQCAALNINELYPHS
jgi:hypothetical protein